MYLLSLTGLLGIAITGDAFNAFVFLEISSLSSYTLIALGRDRRALVAAYQYLILGTIGATFYIIGVGFLYLMTGTLNLGLIAERLADVESSRAGAHRARLHHRRHQPEARPVPAPRLAAQRLCLCAVDGDGLPRRDRPPRSPSISSSATSSPSSAGISSSPNCRSRRSCWRCRSPPSSAPATVAIFQSDVKRMFAYSSVAQIGYITLGIAIATADRPHRRHRPHRQPRAHQGRAVHGARRRGPCASRPASIEELAGHRPQDAADPRRACSSPASA